MQARDDFSKKVVQLLPGVAEKLPPHSIALEESVAGGLLADPKAIARIAGKATPDDFYIEGCRLIFQASADLYGAKRGTDAIAVIQWLSERGLLERAGGQSGILNLMESTVSAAAIDLYVRELNTLRIRRQLIQAAHKQIELANNPELEVQAIVGEASIALTQAAYGYGVSRGRAISEVCADIEKEFITGVSAGIPTDLIDLDTLIGGLQANELIVAAGDSGCGKTQLATYITATVALQGYPVMFFSCEMSDVRITDRLLAHIAEVDSSLIHKRTLHEEEWERVKDANTILSALPIRFCDERQLTPAIMRSELNECTAQFGKPAVIILDYLQLLGGDDANRVRELDQITKQCRSIAQEFNANFFALAQINRAVTTRQVKEPTLGDLRESGGIVHTADRVILLYRDDYYHPDSPDRGKIKLTVAKNRYSAVGSVELLFLPQFSQFKSIAKGRRYDEPPRPKVVPVRAEPVIQVVEEDEGEYF